MIFYLKENEHQPYMSINQIPKTQPTHTKNMASMTTSTTSEDKKIHLYLPKVHFSVMDDLFNLFHSCNVGKVWNVELVPRLHNKDKSNCVMGFITLEPYDTKEYEHLHGEMMMEGNSPKMYYYDNRGQVKYLIVTINKTPNKKQDKVEKTECVMDLIDKQNKRIEELEAMMAKLMKEKETKEEAS